MKITMTHAFEKACKKLHRNQIKFIEDAIEIISRDPEVGELKKGDLAEIRVYKFRIHQQLMLIAYYFPSDSSITLLSLSTHENFYRDLKKMI